MYKNSILKWLQYTWVYAYNVNKQNGMYNTVFSGMNWWDVRAFFSPTLLSPGIEVHLYLRRVRRYATIKTKTTVAVSLDFRRLVLYRSVINSVTRFEYSERLPLSSHTGTRPTAAPSRPVYVPECQPIYIYIRSVVDPFCKSSFFKITWQCARVC